MNNAFIAHPITILYYLRSWWVVFTAPIVRRILQLVLSGEVQKILLSELVTLALAVVMSIIGWFSTRVVVCAEDITIKKGIFLKSSIIIDFSRLLGITARKNLFYTMIGCERCRFNTVSENGKKYELKLKAKDVRRIYNIIYGKNDSLPINKQRRVNQFVVSTTLFAKGIRWFGVKTFCCDKSSMGAVKITQTPIDRYRNVCKLKMILFGECGDSVKIKHIEYKSAIHQIKRIKNDFK